MNKESRKKQQLAFIPRRLDVEGKPELTDFPLNVLFMNFFRLKRKNFSASALYEPDFDSYRKEDGVKRLKYKNKYRQKDTLTIEKRETGWVGRKTINGQKVVTAVGQNWKQFFIHLTSPGLSSGEGCKYEPLHLNKTKSG